LRASLRAEYGIDLDHPGCGVIALAEYTAWLPPGCALWRAIGGPPAWSDETRLLTYVDLHVRELAWMQTKDAKEGRNRPKPVEPPAFAPDREREAERAAAKYEAMQRRAARRAQP